MNHSYEGLFTMNSDQLDFPRSSSLLFFVVMLLLFLSLLTCVFSVPLFTIALPDPEGGFDKLVGVEDEGFEVEKVHEHTCAVNVILPCLLSERALYSKHLFRAIKDQGLPSLG